MKILTCRFIFILVWFFTSSLNAESVLQQIANIETAISKAEIDFEKQKEQKDIKKLLDISKTLYENNKKLKQLISYEPLKVQDIIVSTSSEATKSDEKIYPGTPFYVFVRFENSTDEKVEADISVKDNYSGNVIFTANPTREVTDEHKYVGVRFSPDMFKEDSSFKINFSLKTASTDEVLLETTADVSYFEMTPHFPSELKKGVSKRFSITPPAQFVAPFKLEYESGNGIVLSLNEDSLSGFVGTTSKSKEDFRDGIVLTLSDAKGNKAYDRIYIHVQEPPKEVYTPSTYIPPVITKVEPKKVVPTPKVESTPKYEPAPLSYYEAQQRQAKKKKLDTNTQSTNICSQFTSQIRLSANAYNKASNIMSTFYPSIMRLLNRFSNASSERKRVDAIFRRYPNVSQCMSLIIELGVYGDGREAELVPQGYDSFDDVCWTLEDEKKTLDYYQKKGCLKY